jgi:hypothetical protein
MTMHDLDLIATATAHRVYALLLRLRPSHDGARDRGAVTLEQVLWFVAAGVSVAVVAAILWGKIKSTAEDDTNVVSPSAP